MRSNILVLAAALVCFFSHTTWAGENAPGARQSVDKTDFPDACPRGYDAKLGFFRNVIDDLPEHVGNGKCWSMQSDMEVVTRWKTLLDEHHVKYDGFDWITNGDYKGSIVLFSLTDGRVSRIGVLIPDLTEKYLPGLLSQLKQASSHTKGIDADRVEPKFTLFVHDMHLTGAVSGSHKVTTHTEHHGRVGTDQYGGGSDNVSTEPSFVEVSADPFDWWVFNHVTDAKIRKSIFAHTLMRGMSKEEAVAAKLPHKVAAEDADTNHLIWYSESFKVIDQTVFDDSLGTSTMTHFTPGKTTVARATFANGALTDFKDDEDGALHIPRN